MVTVTIHGTELSFKTDDPDYIHRLAEFVNDQVQRIESSGKTVSPPKAIALAAFNIADELFRLRDQQSEQSKELSARLDAMLSMAREPYRSEKQPDSTV
jgi:cell division protein ZapA (FtsZ GTPase activity inhibitor)